MKKTRRMRKALTMFVCALALVAISVGATLAYLTDTDAVENTFTVGNVVITLDEADVDDSTPEADRDQENEYHLLPGKTYDKDPIVHVDAISEDSYVFIQVVNEIANIEIKTETADEKKIATQILANDWEELDSVAYPGVYYMSYEKGQTDKDLEVFEKVTIDGSIDNATLATFNGKTVKVTAYAIQAEGFDTALEAWAAGNTSTVNGGWVVSEG